MTWLLRVFSFIFPQRPTKYPLTNVWLFPFFILSIFKDIVCTNSNEMYIFCSLESLLLRINALFVAYRFFFVVYEKNSNAASHVFCQFWTSKNVIFVILLIFIKNSLRTRILLNFTAIQSTFQMNRRHVHPIQILLLLLQFSNKFKNLVINQKFDWITKLLVSRSLKKTKKTHPKRNNIGGGGGIILLFSLYIFPSWWVCF